MCECVLCTELVRATPTHSRLSSVSIQDAVKVKLKVRGPTAEIARENFAGCAAVQYATAYGVWPPCGVRLRVPGARECVRLALHLDCTTLLPRLRLRSERLHSAACYH